MGSSCSMAKALMTKLSIIVSLLLKTTGTRRRTFTTFDITCDTNLTIHWYVAFSETIQIHVFFSLLRSPVVDFECGKHSPTIWLSPHATHDDLMLTFQEQVTLMKIGLLLVVVYLNLLSNIPTLGDLNSADSANVSSLPFAVTLLNLSSHFTWRTGGKFVIMLS